MKQSKLKKSSFIEGSLISTSSIIITKVLGILYVIPFYKIIGVLGGSLYSYAYNIYVLFLNISTSGLPTSISKITSEYNSLGLYKSKEKAFLIGKYITFFISLMCFIILFFFSKQISILLIGNSNIKNSIEDISFVIKSVSFCLLIIPFLSITKGYLQGHKFIRVSSISEIIEQVFRIFVLLFGSFVTIKLMHKSVSIGVFVSLLAASLGGIIAFLYLKYKMKENKSSFKKNSNLQNDNISTKEIIKKLFYYSIPLIIISISTNIYTMIDLSLIIRTLSKFNYHPKEIEEISSIISTWGVKICMLITAVSSGVSINLMPNIAGKKSIGDINSCENYINKSINMTLFISLFLALFISINSRMLYIVFYGSSKYGFIILRYLVFVSLLSSLQVILNISLQGLNEYKIVYLNTITGFIINALLDIPLMKLFNTLNIYPFYGAITSSIIGYFISIIIIIIFMKKKYNFKFNYLLIFKKQIFPLLIIFIINFIFISIIKVNNRVLCFLTLSILFIINSLFYVFLSKKLKIINYIFRYNGVK